ncbi:MAG: aminotransferase class I/II-fold pyridoxal phosphate-dependent enzyme, partial [Dehalococcoidia bacterium]
IDKRINPRTKAILLGYPNNPTGAVMDREELLKVAEVAQRHSLVVIYDEVYERLVYGVEHTCFASLPGMRERTILLGGFSKAYAMTGWRLGYAAATEEIIEAMMKIHQYTIMCAPTMAQMAAIKALKEGEDQVQEMVAEYDQRRRVMVKGLNDIGLTCFEPRGAFYAFPSIKSTGLSSDEFAERLLLEERVAVVPGSTFGQCGEGYVRCCYATSMAEIEEALERMGNFVKRHRTQ